MVQGGDRGHERLADGAAVRPRLRGPRPARRAARGARAAPRPARARVDQLQLKSAADALDAWPLERDAALEALRRRDIGALVDALLAEGDTELAWQTATTAVDAELGLRRWVRLAAVRAATHPADALPIYWRAVEDALETSDRRNYAQAVRLLTRAKTAAAAAGQGDDFQAGLAALRERHRRRPTLIAMLSKAKLGPPADNR